MLLRTLLVNLALSWSLASASIGGIVPNSHPQLEVRQNDPAPTYIPVVEPSPPSAPRNVYGGTLVCHAGHISTSNPEFYMSRDEAAGAISTFCGRIDPGVVFKSENGTPFQNIRADGYANYSMAISALWIGGDNCPTMDFSNSTNRAVCQQRLLHDIVDECNTAQNGLEFWKGGGNFTADCLTWSIQRYTSLS